MSWMCLLIIFCDNLQLSSVYQTIDFSVFLPQNEEDSGSEQITGGA